VFDRDRDGKISKSEIAQVIKEKDVQDMWHKDIAELMQAVDTNCDGVIDFTEFMQMMQGAETDLKTS